jgi:D-serine deaminase-like pyridoxal phosphate-dependent protein
MDWRYRQREGLEKPRQAMTVLTTAIGILPQQKTKACVGCGTKNIPAKHTCDYATTTYPTVIGELAEQVKVSQLSEEHGYLEGEASQLPG